MNDTDAADRRRRELLSLQVIVAGLGHHALMHEAGDRPDVPTLLVTLQPAQAGAGQTLALSFYPLDEDMFAGSLFLQYYMVLDTGITQAGLQRLAEVLPDANNRLVVGHFGLARDAGQLHLRHVQRLPAGEPLRREHVADVLRLILYTPRLFAAVLRELAAGRLQPQAARRHIDTLGT